jgi:hypothetical protein
MNGLQPGERTETCKIYDCRTTKHLALVQDPVLAANHRISADGIRKRVDADNELVIAHPNYGLVGENIDRLWNRVIQRLDKVPVPGPCGIARGGHSNVDAASNNLATWGISKEVKNGSEPSPANRVIEDLRVRNEVSARVEEGLEGECLNRYSLFVEDPAFEVDHFHQVVRTSRDYRIRWDTLAALGHVEPVESTGQGD